ncbi:MAG: SDR family oxidoreductase [Deltaproteobacteria bacterium]|nr:SDR family oxidoreductase [Deltaproteobacteria bacterium]
MTWDLRGKTALVTGGAKRIGKEIALGLADEGVNVIIHYLTADKAAGELREELTGKGVGSWTLRADFEKSEYEGLIERAAGEAGTIDILVNNASIFLKNTLDEISFPDLMDHMRINAWAPFELCRDFHRIMKRGKIINLLDSRTDGYDWAHVDYILSKHVFTELTRMIAVKYAPDVAVNGIAPGLILPPPGKDEGYLVKMDRTVPLKRHGTPREIAEACVYLLKSEFLSGEVIYVDGGRHLMEYDHGPHPD